MEWLILLIIILIILLGYVLKLHTDLARLRTRRYTYEEWVECDEALDDGTPEWKILRRTPPPITHTFDEWARIEDSIADYIVNHGGKVGRVLGRANISDHHSADISDHRKHDEASQPGLPEGS